MFSKKCVQLITVAVMAAGAFVGCDSKVGEAPPPPESHELGGTKCLTEVKPVVKNFIDGTATKAEVAAGWDCAETAIETFKRYVRGNSSDRYTSQELATFLEKNFLDASKNETIPVGLQVEVMKLKQIFVGGSAEYISKGEIDKIIKLFGSFREMTVNLTPYMRVLSLNWTVSEANNIQSDVRYFEDANKEIQSAARTLASLIESNGRSYKLADFVVLMEQMGVFFNEKWDFPKTIAKYMPVVLKVKKALAGGDENYVAPSEWRRFALLGARGYIQYLRYYYFIKSVPETGTGYRLSYLSRTVEDVLSVFQDLVAEKPEGVVSRDEVNDLLKTLQVVWPDFKVSNNLVFEAMKVKQLFFGGSVDSFTTTDFETARLKVSRIKILIERFLPYYSIYGREWEPELYENEEAQKLFMESQFVLESTVREAGVLFEGAYDLQDLVPLIREIEALYPPKGESYADMIKDYMPMIIDVKNMILGGNDSSLRKANWSVLLGFAARFYSDFLYYDYFLKEQSFQKPLTISYLSIFANQSINIARDLLAAKKETQFSRAEINKIIQHMSNLGVLPEGLKPKSIDQVVGVVLNNILTAPERRLEGHVPDALNLSSLEVLRNELQVWLDTELFIAQTTENWREDEGYSAKELQEVLKKASVSTMSRQPLASGLYELLLTVQSPVPLTVDNESRVLISNKLQQKYTAKTLRQLNLYRAISRLAVRSFAGTADRVNTYKGVNLEEVQGAFMALRPVLVEAGILDSKNTTFASSRFREANIFVPHSDGSTLASYAELTDLIGMIWSGLNINSMLREELIKKCFNGNTDVKNDALVSLSCARASYKDSLPAAAISMPEYVKFQKAADKDSWAIYMNNIFKAAGYVPNDKNMALLEDISLAPHVIQYIEMIYARFDKNKDGVINTPESLNAFPAFKGILLELAKEQIESGTIKEADLLDLFTYILRYGKPPETIKEKLRFVLSWKGKREKWDVWADRVQLSEILGYIADQVTKSAKANKTTEGGLVNPILSVNQPVQQSQ
ncbi:hypothetical protein AZI87_14470 [Bdellovibrio bacteriovorus]|uniref:EF-hand domain-containing protein n=1 Tax=Bdellovibrio bacteriovorus TaxID=959 RepID=A0A162G290_BDEBC|nr:hypothetical protein [Bdellovibrio bacteriovorus]KYG63599.1 hypothetical protein AZI87_14470 [Bdellovibrio bacteriovorus]